MADLGTVTAGQTVVTADWVQDVNNLRYRAPAAGGGAAAVKFAAFGTAAVRDVQTVLSEMTVSSKDSSAATVTARIDDAIAGEGIDDDFRENDALWNACSSDCNGR